MRIFIFGIHEHPCTFTVLPRIISYIRAATTEAVRARRSSGPNENIVQPSDYEGSGVFAAGEIPCEVTPWAPHVISEQY